MSLLLDAMKKSSGEKATGLSLEEPTTPRSSAPAAEPPAAEAARNAGQALFAAKKKKEAPRRRWKLGLVPTTFLICSTIGAGYGYYVWLEIQPPARQPIARPLPPPTPIAPSVPAPALVPAIPPEPVAVQPPAPEPAAEAAAPTIESAPPARISTPVTPAPRRVTIKRQPQVDVLTPTLQDAWQAYQRGDYVAAEQSYQRALELDPRNRDALLGLGAVAQQQGQDQTAQQYFRQVLQLDPRDPVALAAMSAYATDSADAETRLQRRLAEQPQAAALHFALGNLYADQSRWAEAQQAYFDARALEPNNPLFTFNLAVSLDHLGQGRLAAEHYRQALQQDGATRASFDHAQAQRRLTELTAR
ncbi:MAG: tetratricopeptide repeat protein [Pseudomonadota bacterium]